jgi:hypothetical protein
MDVRYTNVNVSRGPQIGSRLSARGVQSDILSCRTYECASGLAEKCHSHFVRVGRLGTLRCSSR